MYTVAQNKMSNQTKCNFSTTDKAFFYLPKLRIYRGKIFLTVAIFFCRHRSVPVPCENGLLETTVAEEGRNPVAGLWGRTLGESWPPEPPSSYTSIDFWCQLVASLIQQLADLLSNADEQLFTKMGASNHCLHQLLPPPLHQEYTYAAQGLSMPIRASSLSL